MSSFFVVGGGGGAVLCLLYEVCLPRLIHHRPDLKYVWVAGSCSALQASPSNVAWLKDSILSSLGCFLIPEFSFLRRDRGYITGEHLGVECVVSDFLNEANVFRDLNGCHLC